MEPNEPAFGRNRSDSSSGVLGIGTAHNEIHVRKVRDSRAHLLLKSETEGLPIARPYEPATGRKLVEDLPDAPLHLRSIAVRPIGLFSEPHLEQLEPVARFRQLSVSHDMRSVDPVGELLSVRKRLAEVEISAL